MAEQLEELDQTVLTGFWLWWDGARHRISRAIDSSSLTTAIADEITGAVRELHKGFAWELGPGRRSRHALTVSSDGDIALRRLTEAWLRSAPQPDATWEYFPARQPAAELHLSIFGHTFRLDDFVVAFTDDAIRNRFDVVLYHRDFVHMIESERGQVAFLALDQLLGEDDVERWVGALSVSVQRPEGGLGMRDLLLAIDRSRSRIGDQFTLGQGESRDGKPVILVVNSGLKQIDHLEHVFHVMISIALRRTNETGMPETNELQELDRAQDVLLKWLGDGAAELGRVTWDGRRVIHLFVRDPKTARSAIAEWKPNWPWQIEYVLEADPHWTAAKVDFYAPLARRT